MKILIVGCGKIGKTIVQELSKEDYDLYLLDRNKDVITELSTALDCLGVTGDANNVEDLELAGVKDSDVIVAVCQEDETNMLTCLFAKSLNPNIKTIARVRDPKFSKSIATIKEQIGIDNIVNPEELTAREIYSILANPAALKTETFARSRIRALTFVVPANCFLVNQKVSEVSKEISNSVLLLGIERDDETFVVSGDTVIKENDKLTVIGRPIAITSLLQRVGVINKVINTIAIAGASSTSLYLAKQLNQAKKDITVIDKDKQAVEHFLEALPNVHGIYGDATDSEVILEEGINNCDAFISLTGFDETNVMISLYMRQNSKAKVLTKINHIEFNDLLDGLDLGSVITPKTITALQVVRIVRGYKNAYSSANISSLHKVMNNKVELSTFEIKTACKVTDTPLKELKLKNNILICAIIRDDKVIIPGGNDTIHKGDLVLVASMNRIENIEGITNE